MLNLVFTTMFLNTLTPKFYVALTGTSSLISALILIFEWWYFKKYGTSFIEQFTVNYLSPWLGGADNNSENGDETPEEQIVPECKVWQNPLSLFRGAEYQRFQQATGTEPLTYFDMNLSAQDHQTLFTCEDDNGKSEYEAMQIAWRERDKTARISAAKDVLEKNPDCTPAMILLAEEECSTIMEVEKLLRQAQKCAECSCRRSLSYQHNNTDAVYKRDVNILVYIRRRLAMCARKLGRVKESVKMMRELIKDFPSFNLFNIHENLIESLLEIQAYPDVQALIAKYDGDINIPKSAVLFYTAALLKARLVADKFTPESAWKRGLSSMELSAVEAIHRAVQFNPHAPKYLLEMKAMILPPEHILKRGDSEGVAYSFFHLQHWKRVDGALNLLYHTWQGAFRMIPYPLEKGVAFCEYSLNNDATDRDLLPAFHDSSAYPKKDLPSFILFTGGLCSFTALLAVLTLQYPDNMSSVFKLIIGYAKVSATYVMETFEFLLPSNLLRHLSTV